MSERKEWRDASGNEEREARTHSLSTGFLHVLVPLVPDPLLSVVSRDREGA